MTRAKKKIVTSTALVMTSTTATQVELQEAAPAATAVLEALREIEVATPEQAAWVGEKLHDLKGQWQVYEERRTAVTAPMNAALDEVNGWFRPVQQPLKEAEKILKGKLADWTRRAAAERPRALAAAAAGDASALARTAPPVVPEGVSVGKPQWVPVVEDAELVPREFCSPDVTKLKAARDWSAYDEQNPPPAIVGVRFELRSRVSVRGS